MSRGLKLFPAAAITSSPAQGILNSYISEAGVPYSHKAGHSLLPPAMVMTCHCLPAVEILQEAGDSAFCG